MTWVAGGTSARDPWLMVSTAEPRRRSGEGAGPRSDGRLGEAGGAGALPPCGTPVNTDTGARTPASRRLLGAGPSLPSCSGLSCVHTPGLSPDCPPPGPRTPPASSRSEALRGPVLVGRTPRSESGNMRDGVGTWPRDVATAPPGLTRNRSAIPRVSPGLGCLCAHALGPPSCSQEGLQPAGKF